MRGKMTRASCAHGRVPALLAFLAACAAAACGGPGGGRDAGETDGDIAADGSRDDGGQIHELPDDGNGLDDDRGEADDADSAAPPDTDEDIAGDTDAGGDGGIDLDAEDDTTGDTGDAADATDGGEEESGIEPMRIYIAPDGDDRRDGSSRSLPILTLGRAQALIRAAAPNRDVEVRIFPGRYFGQKVVWDYTMPAHRIRFMPVDDDGNRPFFDGCLEESPADPVRGCPGGTWFILRHSAGQETNLHFEYIRVERYQTAISLEGNRNAEAASNGSNRIYGCWFARIGNGFAPHLAYSTAAVRLVNSDDNVIENNHFVDIINATSAGLLHAIYAAHMSDRNSIQRNRFQNNAGDPMRIRDFSNHNVINGNRFIKVGTTAAYTEWYCDHEVRTDCTKPGPECPSWENQFRDNFIDGDYGCNRLPVWDLAQDDTTAGCSPPAAGDHRLHTSGNTVTATPCSSLGP